MDTRTHSYWGDKLLYGGLSEVGDSGFLVIQVTVTM